MQYRIDKIITSYHLASHWECVVCGKRLLPLEKIGKRHLNYTDVWYGKCYFNTSDTVR